MDKTVLGSTHWIRDKRVSPTETRRVLEMDMPNDSPPIKETKNYSEALEAKAFQESLTAKEHEVTTNWDKYEVRRTQGDQ